jgi:predicted HAD superfamily phosphohydrolase
MGQSSGKVFITDCEGPVTKNDNAAELSEAFIPQGDRFFAKISLYDDYLAEVAHKSGYKAGDTLRLILPFFKAFGLDHERMVRFSGQHIEMIPHADLVLLDILDRMPAYIVSTSYAPYIKAVCEAIGFPLANTYCTVVNVDAYPLGDNEKAALIGFHQAILDLPDFVIPSGATSPDDLSEESRQVVAELDRIFWTALPRMEINRIVEEVNPVGGKEKARAIEEIAASEGSDLRDVCYVGDSITDVAAFRLVKSAGGMTISFNGNDWAVNGAAFAVTARNAFPIGWLADLFASEGREGFEDLLMSEINPETAERVANVSGRVRKDVRTQKIGSLG